MCCLRVTAQKYGIIFATFTLKQIFMRNKECRTESLCVCILYIAVKFND